MKAQPQQFAGRTLIVLASAAMPFVALSEDIVGTPGSQTVERVCSNCHGDGLMGAPRIGDSSAWKARLVNAGSIDNLAGSAAHGKGNMPPRGGQSALTDAELKAAIRWMLNKSGALDDVSSRSP